VELSPEELRISGISAHVGNVIVDEARDGWAKYMSTSRWSHKYYRFRIFRI